MGGGGGGQVDAGATPKPSTLGPAPTGSTIPLTHTHMHMRTQASQAGAAPRPVGPLCNKTQGGGVLGHTKCCPNPGSARGGLRHCTRLAVPKTGASNSELPTRLAKQRSVTTHHVQNLSRCAFVIMLLRAVATTALLCAAAWAAPVSDLVSALPGWYAGVVGCWGSPRLRACLLRGFRPAPAAL
jgi:hypothetical protein